MNPMLRGVFTLGMLLCCVTASANEVQILGAEFQQQKSSAWTVSVVLLHDDSGWEHYADKWRLVDGEGEVLGERVLLHPHEDEQPFMRSETGIRIPDDTSLIYVEAHDLVHGWTENRLTVDLSQAANGHLSVLAND